MSAPNFYAKSGKYFAIEIESEDGYEIDDAIENITAEFEAIKRPKIYTEQVDEHDGDRNYPGRAFLKLGLVNEREDIQTTAALVVRSGYYAHANIDIDVQVYDGYSGDHIEPDELTVDDVKSILQGYHDRTVTDKQAAATLRRIQRDCATLDNLAGQLLKEYTTPLIRTALFSNGEAIYERQLLRG